MTKLIKPRSKLLVPTRRKLLVGAASVLTAPFVMRGARAAPGGGYLGSLTGAGGSARSGGAGPPPDPDLIPTEWNTRTTDTMTVFGADFLSAIVTASNQSWVKAIAGFTGSGKYYFEHTVTEYSGDAAYSIGIADAAFGGTQYHGGVGAACLYMGDFSGGASSIFINNTGVVTGLANVAEGSVVGVAVDFDGDLIYFSDDGVWFEGANPSAGTGGRDISSITGAIQFPMFFSHLTNCEGTTNFGATPFAGSVPTGFLPGWGVAYDGITTPARWNASDKTGAVAVNGNGFRTLSGAGSPQFVRTDIGRSSGKYYLEVFYETASFGADAFVGLSKAGYNPASDNAPGGADDKSAGWYIGLGSSNQVWVNGSSVNTVGADITVGHILGMAVDLDNMKLYLHDNGSYLASNNPSAGTGGFDISTMTLSSTLYVTMCDTNLPLTLYLNSGQKAFTYSVPTGYLPGWGT